MSHECQYCKKKLSTKYSLNLHQKTTSSCLDIQKSLSIDITSLKSKLCIYKELAENNQATIEELAKQPKTQHNNNKKTINKVSIKNDYIQNMPPLCLDEDTISKRINQGFTIADFNNGVKGVARVICEEVAIGEDKDGMIRSAIGCTDPSRKIFSYTTENGASINDPKAFNIMSKTQPFIDIKAAKFASDQIQEYPDNVEDISTKYLDIQGIPENETVFLDALSQLSINNMNNYMETQKRKLKSKKIRKD